MRQEENRNQAEIRRAICGLTERLQADGLSSLRYTLRDKKMRATAVRHGKSWTQTDAEDRQLSIAGVFEGRRAMCSFTGLPDAETASALLRESAQISEETAGSAEESKASRKVDAQAAGGALQSEKRKLEETSADTALSQKLHAVENSTSVKAAAENSRVAAFLWEPHEDVCAQLAKAEAAAYALPETALVENCRYEQQLTELRIFSEDGGLLLSDASGYRCMRAAVIAEKNGSRAYTGACRYGKCLADTGPEELLKETAEEAAGELFGTSLPSGTYRVLLKNDVAAELLEAYIPAFYESRLKDGQSALCGRSEAAAADFLSLREDPELPAGRVTRRVDDEGTPVSAKYLLRNGRLETRLCKSPEKAGEPESTGNGFQPDPQSDVETGVTNVILESDAAHQRTQEELLAALSDGLYVTGIDGAFAGTNVKTGSFSLIARGQVVKGGKSAGAFCEVTIAANFFDLLARVTAAGKTYAATAPDMACVLAPALLAEGVVVSGL